MYRPESLGFRPPPWDRLKIRLAAAETRQPARGLALDQRLERLADQRRFLAYPGVSLRLGQKRVVQSNRRPHFSPPAPIITDSSFDVAIIAGGRHARCFGRIDAGPTVEWGRGLPMAKPGLQSGQDRSAIPAGEAKPRSEE